MYMYTLDVLLESIKFDLLHLSRYVLKLMEDCLPDASLLKP